jgi:predicted neutral ceramidase superfamily lipid hydrolase
LGEISPVGAIVYFGQLGFENYRSSPNIWDTFYTIKVLYMSILTKMVWATVWAIFFHKLIWSPCSLAANLNIKKFLTMLFATFWIGCQLAGARC